jgi:hypothetical protein
MKEFQKLIRANDTRSNIAMNAIKASLLTIIQGLNEGKHTSPELDKTIKRLNKQKALVITTITTIAIQILYYFLYILIFFL